MDLELDLPIFFRNGDDNSDMFKEIIYAQQEDCCSNKINEEYMSTCYQNFTHGFMILGESDQRHFRGNEYFLKAFVLFEYRNLKYSGKTIKGKAICCNPKNKGFGRLLLNCVKDFAIKHNAERWVINALAFEKLIAYYQGFGFDKYSETDYPDGRKKTIKMVMRFTEEYDMYDYDNSEDESCFEKSSSEESSSDEECNNISRNLYKI